MSVCEQLQLKTDTMEADMTWYDWVGISQEHGWSWSWIWGGVALDQLWWEQKTNQPLSPHRFIQSVRSVRLRSSARCSKFNFQSQSHKLGSAMPADHRGRISFILAMMSLNGFGMSEDISWTPSGNNVFERLQNVRRHILDAQVGRGRATLPLLRLSQLCLRAQSKVRSSKPENKLF